MKTVDRILGHIGFIPNVSVELSCAVHHGAGRSGPDFGPFSPSHPFRCTSVPGSGVPGSKIVSNSLRTLEFLLSEAPSRSVTKKRSENGVNVVYHLPRLDQARGEAFGTWDETWTKLDTLKSQKDSFGQLRSFARGSSF